MKRYTKQKCTNYPFWNCENRIKMEICTEIWTKILDDKWAKCYFYYSGEITFHENHGLKR